MIPAVNQEHLKRGQSTLTSCDKPKKIYIHFNRFHNGDPSKIWHLLAGGKSAFVGEWRKHGNVRTWSEFGGINHPQPSAFVVAYGRIKVNRGVATILP